MRNEPNNLIQTGDQEMVELLEALRDEARAGRLKALVFALADPRTPDALVVDSCGSHEVVEIACRKVVEHIASRAAVFNPELAKAIRVGMHQRGLN